MDARIRKTVVSLNTLISGAVFSATLIGIVGMAIEGRVPTFDFWMLSAFVLLFGGLVVTTFALTTTAILRSPDGPPYAVLMLNGAVAALGLMHGVDTLGKPHVDPGEALCLVVALLATINFVVLVRQPDGAAGDLG